MWVHCQAACIILKYKMAVRYKLQKLLLENNN
jgi:hypothetical protein